MVPSKKWCEDPALFIAIHFILASAQVCLMSFAIDTVRMTAIPVV